MCQATEFFATAETNIAATGSCSAATTGLSSRLLAVLCILFRPGFFLCLILSASTSPSWPLVQPCHAFMCRARTRQQPRAYTKGMYKRGGWLTGSGGHLYSGHDSRYTGSHRTACVVGRELSLLKLGQVTKIWVYINLDPSARFALLMATRDLTRRAGEKTNGLGMRFAYTLLFPEQSRANPDARGPATKNEVNWRPSARQPLNVGVSWNEFLPQAGLPGRLACAPNDGIYFSKIFRLPRVKGCVMKTE